MKLQCETQEKLLSEAKILYDQGRLREAEVILSSHQHDSRFLFALLQVKSARGQWAEALTFVEKLESFGYSNADLFLLKGNILRELDYLPDAHLAYDHAIEITPNNSVVLSNRGALRKLMGRIDEAEQDLLSALRLRPNFADARFHLAGVFLQRGEFSIGWGFYEDRLNTKLVPKASRFYPDEKRWRGLDFPLSGKKLLIYSEQGLGDVIQFSRFIPALIAMGADLICQIPGSLHRLFSKQWPGLKLVDVKPIYSGHYDWHCSLVSVPYLIGAEAPPNKPWLVGLRVDPKCEHSTRPRVGLVWSGKLGRDLERYTSTRRSITLDLLAPVLKDDVSYICLQPDLSSADKALMQKLGIEDMSGRLTDFYETAVLMNTLDLVISIDTSVIHVAGGMGIPAWVILPMVTDYRWAGLPEGSAWYPDVRIFRQTSAGDWKDPIREVASALWQKFH